MNHTAPGLSGVYVFYKARNQPYGKVHLAALFVKRKVRNVAVTSSYKIDFAIFPGLVTHAINTTHLPLKYTPNSMSTLPWY